MKPINALDKKNIEDIFALTPMQEGMLFYYLKYPGSDEYFEQLSLGISGKIDREIFEKAWNFVIGTNEMLRAVFRWEKVEKPIQLILKEHQLQPNYYDFSRTAPKEVKIRLEGIKANDKKKGFDLRNVPFRVILCKLEEDEYEMIISNHHILYDGWSTGIILMEFLRYYNDPGQGKNLKMPVKTKFKEFVKWYHQRDKDKEKKFWKNYLQGFDTQSMLPNKQRIRDKSVTDKYCLCFETDIVDQLKIFIKQHKITLAAFLYTAWGILLTRYSNSDDVIFGTTVSGRSAPVKGIENIVGLFINTLPLRVYLRGGETAADLLYRIDNTLRIREPYEHTSLVDIKECSEIDGNRELFDCILVIENYPLDRRWRQETGILLVHSYTMEEESHYDLTVSVMLHEHENIEVNFCYNSHCFNKEAIKRLTDHFSCIVREIIEKPGKEPFIVGMLGEEEKRRLLAEFNYTEVDYPKDKSIHQLFEEQTGKTPDNIALVGDYQLHQQHEKPEETRDLYPAVDTVSITYKTLNQQSHQLARSLIKKGVAPDMIVGLMVERSVEMIIGILGILKAGGAYLPIGADYPEKRMNYMLLDSSAKILVTERDLSKKIKVEKEIIYLSDAINFLRGRAAVVPTLPHLHPSPEPVTSLAYIIYTSGTTGRPKGVMIEHRNVVRLMFSEKFQFDFSSSDTWTMFHSYCFDFSVWEMYGALLYGGKLAIISKTLAVDSPRYLETLKKEKVTILNQTPSAFYYLMNLELTNPQKELSLRYIIFAGEALVPAMLKGWKAKYPGTKLINMYGITETTVHVTFKEIGNIEIETGISNIGKSIPTLAIFILDKHMRLLPVGVSGELYVLGKGVGRGYLNQLELTEEKFKRAVIGHSSLIISSSGKFSKSANNQCPMTNDRLYKSGDLGRWLQDGNIEFLGRIDQQVKIRGFRIELGEIENQLSNHNNIKEAVVTVKKDPSSENYLCGYFVSDEELSLPDIKAYLSRTLPEYMVPSFFVRLERLPLNSNGKVDRQALPDPEIHQSPLKNIDLPSWGDVEKAVIEAWRRVLKIDRVGLNDNFFDIGGNSLKIIRLSSSLTSIFKREISVPLLFRYPTISVLVRYLSGEKEIGKPPHSPAAVANKRKTAGSISVVGMAGRFPGAQNINEFWNNLTNGIESITFFSREELLESGLEPGLISNPNYVKVRGVLEDRDCFDAAFFSYSSREAEILDPQVRVLLECSWAALEDAGYNPYSYQGTIGVYAGSSNNSLWTDLISSGMKGMLMQYHAMLLTGKDFLSTHIAYNLNLKGPGLTIQTACSTWLVALDAACQALSTGKCMMALVGGGGISGIKKSGYLYEEGMIFSPDGHCRAFDARARGIVPGEGVGVVVLKSLAEALADEDFIYALIKGSAVNNDGMGKVGFTAPGIEGQAAVIRAAHHVAGIDPESIGYIETHGTGTSLGDPVEMESLKLAFGSHKKQFCAVGSVKTNIGHLDAAAGAAGFIKTVLALKHKLIPPSLHCHTPNPKIEFEDSPFYVIQRLSPWKNQAGPLRAGVSSFGVGGTNAHVVLEEWPGDRRRESESGPPEKETQLILLSAKTKAALDSTTHNLADHFKKNPGINLANAAYTLQVGRVAFKYRRMLVCGNIHEAVDTLSSPGSSHLNSFAAKEEKQPMVFMFPGQGSQYVEMGWGLYLKEPAFKEDMDRCFEILKPLLGYDIKEIIYPKISVSESSREEMTKKIHQTEIAQPILFMFEYALAKQLMRWEIQPDAMIGHSIGEYTAACVAGVFSLEDALSLVAMRGKLMQQLPPGRMVSVPQPQEKVKSLLTGELSLAAVNSSSLCTVSGPPAAVDSFEKRLNEKGYESRILHTSHAFHSKMMDAILDEFKKEVEKITRHQPHIPFISNLSGQWITGEQAQSPRYWAHHLRKTVLFSRGINELLKEHHVFLEVGPGKTLSTFVKKNDARKPDHRVEDLVRHPQENVHDYNFLLHRLGKLWLYGKDIDWSGFYHGKKRQRIPLPTYPFEKNRYWPDRLTITGEGESKKNPVDNILQGKKPDIADWFYIPSWERSLFPLFSLQEDIDTKSICSCWLFFMDERGIGERLVKKIEKNNNVIIVKIGPVFSRLSDREYAINPCEASSYDILLKELKRLELIPHRIVHLWGITGDMGGTLDIPRIRRALDLGFYSLFHLSRGLGKHNFSHELRIMVLTDNMQEVTGTEALCPEKAPLLGAVKVIPLEYPHINCRSIDIVLPPGESGKQETDKLVDHLLAEITGDAHDKVIAFRGLHRWHPLIEPVRFELPAEVENIRRTKPGGVYLITGGLGGMGLSIAQYLSRFVKAKLVLVGRSTFPAREKWEQLSQDDNRIAENIRKIQEMEKMGAEVMVLSADAADERQMQLVIDRVIKRFGKLNGIIHTAGVADYGGVIQRRTREETEKILLPKVYGTVVLDRIVKDMKLDFFVLCSTIGNIAYHQKLGQVGYSAANEFLDAFAYYKNLRDAAAGKIDTLTVSINWPDLKDVGMAVKSSEQWAKMFNTDSQTLLEDGLLVSEAVEVFRRVLDKGFPQVVVSPVNLVTKIEEGASLLREVLAKGSVSLSIHQRPELTTTYVPPKNELEQMIASQFRQLFGIKQVGIHDNFFDLGATSLDIIRLNSKLKEELKRDIPLVSMYNYSTIHSLSKYLGEEETNKMEKESEKSDALDESRRIMKNTLRKIMRS